MSVRPATHGGLWYSNSSSKLAHQMEAYFMKAASLKEQLYGDDDVTGPVSGARILIGPHAGYSYSGERLAETFTVWDTSKVKRVFILGPSHHVYFKNYAQISKYDYYETPLGNLPVDSTVSKALASYRGNRTGAPVFKYMSEEVDEDEHSFEMHAPYIYYRSKGLAQGVPSIIPIMISGMDDGTCDDLASALSPYLADEENTFIVSSDFCHWGYRFGFTEYLKRVPSGTNISSNDIVTLTPSTATSPSMPIHRSIEHLDKLAMLIASKGSHDAWKKYIALTGNTICGQRPIYVILKMLDKYKIQKPDLFQGQSVFNWINYSQSSPVRVFKESSVSYASGYVKLAD
ncbi:Piso0_005007 [Millerozyma farinosa CBS 7064]|uniref:Piso0_005007 protein n=1 Tax=Pichia sorbitophila (strain ATCC MYA-4447 / BCRC 22081 / CBS 7064 / NBRC 10061 / NRRL Y-12695) TaxID=559304 RepID=G8Y109_PICSO|nr:Piso0_005007 [Millerozyma farinosa CBS 7064]